MTSGCSWRLWTWRLDLGDWARHPAGAGQRRGYRGPYSLETFNPSYWEESPEEIARRGKAALDRLFSEG